METDRQWMEPNFALFNCHCNDAETKAKAAFVAKFGKRVWNRRIRPFIDRGVMSIFNEPPNEWTQLYVDWVHAFVNEGVVKYVESDP